jgi:hypothetical protein
LGFCAAGDWRSFAKSSGLICTSAGNEEAAADWPSGKADAASAGAATISRFLLLRVRTDARSIEITSMDATLNAFRPFVMVISSSAYQAANSLQLCRCAGFRKSQKRCPGMGAFAAIIRDNRGFCFD